MSAQSCPNCGSSDTSVESRRRHPKNSTTVGSWRIPYSLFFGSLVLVFGLAALFLGRATTDTFMGQLAMVVSAASLVLAAFILGSAMYINRWTETEELFCEACDHRWSHEEEVLSSNVE